MIANVIRHHGDALLGIEYDYLNAQGAQPFDSALEITGVADYQPAEAELAYESAAVPAGREGRDHDHFTIASLASGIAESIRFAVQGRIAVLYTAVVARSYETAAGVKDRGSDRKSALGEAFPRLSQRDREHSVIGGEVHRKS